MRLALASLAALDASPSASTPPLAMAVVAHEAMALALLATLDTLLSTRTSPPCNGSACFACGSRLACRARCFARCAHAALCSGGGRPCGRSACIARGARRFAQRTHAALCNGGGSLCGCRASLSERTPPFAVVVATPAAAALASLAALNALLSARTPPLCNRSTCFACGSCLACCARRLARRKHAAL